MLLNRRLALGLGAVGIGALSWPRLGKAAEAESPGQLLGPFGLACPTAPDPAWPRIAQFLGKTFDRARTDATPALEKAARWSSVNGTPVVVDQTLMLASSARIDADGARLHFDCAHLQLRDDIPETSTRANSLLQIGLHILGNDISLLGQCMISGLDKPGATFLQGVFFDEVQRPNIDNFVLRNLAIGLHFMCCDEVRCGATIAHGMWGRQGLRNQSNGAGTAQAISGCRNSVFGELRSYSNDKPARYLSVGWLANGGQRDNSENVFGLVHTTARPNSPWAHPLTVRSSVNGTFAGGSGEDVNFLINVEKYTADDAYQIHNNHFGDWSGTLRDSPESSVDGALHLRIDDGAAPIGSNRIGKVRATMPQLPADWFRRPSASTPQTFGLWCNSGDWQIERLELSGFTYGVQAFDCKLRIGELDVARNELQVIRYGRGLNGKIDRLSMKGDLAALAGADRSLFAPLGAGLSSRAPSFSIGVLERGALPAAARRRPVKADAMFPDKSFRVERASP